MSLRFNITFIDVYHHVYITANYLSNKLLTVFFLDHT